MFGYRSIFNTLLVLTLTGYYLEANAQDWKIASEADRCPAKWGEGDQRGSANMMTPVSVLAALQLAKTGEVFELGEVLSTDPNESYINRGRVFNIYTKPTIPAAGRRVSSEELVVTELGQVGTQLDGFAHQLYGDSFYNCFKFEDIATRTGYKKLGVENIGSLISRGILIDIAALKGVDMIEQDYEITLSDIHQALNRQNTKIESGDAVIINTGWGGEPGCK